MGAQPRVQQLTVRPSPCHVLLDRSERVALLPGRADRRQQVAEAVAPGQCRHGAQGLHGQPATLRRRGDLGRHRAQRVHRGTAASGGVGGLASGIIGGLMTAWFNIVTVVIGVGAEAQNAVFGVLALVAVAFTTDRSKIGVIRCLSCQGGKLRSIRGENSLKYVQPMNISALLLSCRERDL